MPSGIEPVAPQGKFLRDGSYGFLTSTASNVNALMPKHHRNFPTVSDRNTHPARTAGGPSRSRGTQSKGCGGFSSGYCPFRFNRRCNNPDVAVAGIYLEHPKFKSPVNAWLRRVLIHSVRTTKSARTRFDDKEPPRVERLDATPDGAEVVHDPRTRDKKFDAATLPSTELKNGTEYSRDDCL